MSDPREPSEANGAAARVVLITGAGCGIGAALALRVAAPRVALMLHARGADDASRQRLSRVAAACTTLGADCATECGELAEAGVAAHLIHQTLANFGALDQLVATAGHAQRQTLSTLDTPTFTHAFAAIPAAFAELVKHATPALAASNRARVVALSSVVAHRYRADAPFAATAAAKAALESLAKSAAAELAPHGVTVNCVAPGYLRDERGACAERGASAASAVTAVTGVNAVTAVTAVTAVNAVKAANAANAANAPNAVSATEAGHAPARARAADPTPLGALAEPAEVAALIAFLLSDEARHITGQVIHIDGGLTLG